MYHKDLALQKTPTLYHGCAPRGETGCRIPSRKCSIAPPRENWQNLRGGLGRSGAGRSWIQSIEIHSNDKKGMQVLMNNCSTQESLKANIYSSTEWTGYRQDHLQCLYLLGICRFTSFYSPPHLAPQIFTLAPPHPVEFLPCPRIPALNHLTTTSQIAQDGKSLITTLIQANRAPDSWAREKCWSPAVCFSRRIVGCLAQKSG